MAPEVLFGILHRPRDICAWWSASSAIVIPRTGGLYAIAWGDLDDPDYVSSATIRTFESPQRLVLVDYQYYAKDGLLPIDADFVVTFEVEQRGAEGSLLRVTHDGFPPGSEDFYARCVQGWADTCGGMQRHLAPPAEPSDSSTCAGEDM